MKFRTKTILGIGLIETVLLVVLVLSSIGFLSRSNDEQIQNRAGTTASLFATTTKDAVLSTDLDSLQTYIDELLTNQDIAYVRIVGDATVLAQGGDSRFLDAEFNADTSLANIDDDVFDVAATIEESGYQFGRVELGLSVTATTQLIARAWRWAAGIATIEIILVAIFSYVLGTYLTRQLLSLTRASDTISAEGPGYQIDYSGNDEIAQVSQSFNQMSRSLAETYARLNTSASEYRELAEQLAESDARKSSMLSSALDGIVTIDSDGMVEEFNAAAEEIFGYTADEVIGKPMRDFIIPEEHLDAHDAGMERWKETGDGAILGRRLELTARRKNGEVFPVELAITPVTVNDETIFTGFMRDITSQKNSELELRLAASAFDAQEGIFITDQDSRIIRANNAFSAITGFTHKDALGSTPAVLFKSGRHDEEFYRQMWRQLIDSGRWEGEIYNRRKNGEIYPQWLGISAIRDDAGKLVNYIAHFIDISERKSFEEELVASSQKAEAANIAKSQFLATMSHEIRTPLNGVIGMTDLLLNSDMQPKQKHMLRTANHSAQILLDIIKNILDFSKIESGEMTLEELPVSIGEIVEETCEILAPVAAQKELKLILLIDPGADCLVISDPVRLHQILFNLVSNAVKFTRSDGIGEGRIIVKIQVEDAVAEIDYVPFLITVEDNGIGIKQDTLRNIFEPFEQAELSTTRQYGGSGLGLAITRRIVDAMGGAIDVESIYGSGSRFTVRAPFKRVENAVQLRQALPQKKILIVEAYSPLDTYLPSYLERQGAITTQVNDLEQASQQISRLHGSADAFDAVVVGVAWKHDQQIDWIGTLRVKLPSLGTQFILLTDTLSQPDRGLPNVRYVNSFPLLPSDLVVEVTAAVQKLPVEETGGPGLLDSESTARQVFSYPDQRILLVEDNEVNQDVIRLQLMELGFQADVAVDGVEGLALFRQKDYNLVITDCHMPNMDGYELTREIRRSEGDKSRVPIIAISADSLGPQRQSWEEIGMNAYLTKPLRVDALKVTLMKFVRTEQADAMPVGNGLGGERAEETEYAIFDRNALKELVGNTSSVVRYKLLEKFIRTGQASMESIKSSLSKRDIEAIQREGHKLKSSARAMGAFRLSQQCGLMEEACQNGDDVTIDEQIDLVLHEFSTASAEIGASIQNAETSAGQT